MHMYYFLKEPMVFMRGIVMLIPMRDQQLSFEVL